MKRNHKDFIKNNKLILKIQQGFKSERHNAFTEEMDKISLMMIKEYKQLIQQKHMDIEPSNIQ